MLVKMGSSSPNRGENTKYLKPPPSSSSSLGHGIFVVSLGIGVSLFTPKVTQRYDLRIDRIPEAKKNPPVKDPPMGQGFFEPV